MTRINKKTRDVTFICWPRNVDVSAKDAKPYPGWPFTFNQLDNYGRKTDAYLPSLEINRPNQVVQVINEKTEEILYTIRIKGSAFRPKVFSDGSYTINVGEGNERKSLKGIKANSKEKTLKVTL